jgi:predicted aminopeptidase
VFLAYVNRWKRREFLLVKSKNSKKNIRRDKMQTQFDALITQHKENLAKLYPKVSDEELKATAEKIVKKSSGCYVPDRL